jgi:hypothetical protein
MTGQDWSRRGTVGHFWTQFRRRQDKKQGTTGQKRTGTGQDRTRNTVQGQEEKGKDRAGQRRTGQDRTVKDSLETKVR